MANKINFITGETYTLSELFSGERRIIIPDLQRDYCWGDDNNTKSTSEKGELVTDFVNNLLDQFNEQRSKNDKSTLNLGLFYGYEVPADHIQLCDGQQRLTTLFLLLGMINKKTDKFRQHLISLYVIDGQQRLTTSIIFFSAFINTLKHRETEWINSDEADVIKSLMDDISDYYLKDIRRERQKFITVPYDNNFFTDAVIDHKNNVSQEDLSSKSKIAMYNALIYFEEELANATIEELLSWTSSLENASITTFIVRDKLQAAQIFAYQYDRGKRLTNLEVLKAYFMLQIYRSQNNEDNIIYVEKAFEEIYHYIVLVTVEEDNVLNYYGELLALKDTIVKMLYAK